MQRLYFVISLDKPPQGDRFWIPLILVYLPVTIVSLIASSQYDPMGLENVNRNNALPPCPVPNRNDSYSGILYFMVLLQIVYLWVITAKITMVRDNFKEFGEHLIINAIVTISFTASFILVTSNGVIYLSVTILVILLNTIGSVTATVGYLIMPLLGLILNKDEYAMNWKMEIISEQLPMELNYNSGKQTTVNVFDVYK
ncbi:hypothetical protein HDV06_005694 [Boothiomyces sp. JEL0866]|nr:hypothetical protein HDV06_001378 [Boothiomyces sp. JEL0866]KAJ3320129.1 hypothetical protein HDV06_005694 [Boothiomyces sp. JEL0866]